MKRKFFLVKVLSVFLFFLVFASAYSCTQTTELKTRLRLETAGLNNALIKGSVSGNFSFSEEVTYLALTFYDSLNIAVFDFEGSGGFVSLAGEPKRLREQIRKTFRLNAQEYLRTTESLGFSNAAILIGSFVSQNEKTRLVCSSFGNIFPNTNILFGQYQLSIIGENRKGDQVLNATGDVTVSNLPVN